jgi:hypothetical protein
MKKKLVFFILLLTAHAFLLMGKNEYVVTLPEGKLPWPHHRPDMTRSEYDDLLKNLWIINNFGQYQALEDKSLVYFHDGLDIVLDNGTKIYAVESGYVKDIYNETSGYGYIVIGESEGDQPGNAWMYVHVTNFQFLVGDHVDQGDYIADIYFEGLEHMHFGKIFVEDNRWDDYYNWNCVHPDRYFIYKDMHPPIIKVPFYYFKNNSNRLFNNDTTGKLPTLQGDVDIVVGMRDPGEFAHSKENGFGDRLCVARIEYEIASETTLPVYKKSFDFTKMILNNGDAMGEERVFTVFKHYKLFNNQIGYDFWNKTFSYYIITNAPETAETGELQKIDIAQGNLAWNTAELDESGNPRFPNGLYIITVIAYDALGNSSSASDIVLVGNKKKTKIRR